MNIESETQAAAAVQRVLCFLHGLDIGRQGRPAISQMILDLCDVHYFLEAERDVPSKAPASADRSPQGGNSEGGSIGEADESAVPNEDSADAQQDKSP